MHIQSFTKLAGIIAFAFVVQLASYAQSIDEIINKHVAAMGGDKYTNLKSVKIESSTQIMGMDLPSSTTIAQGRGLRSETNVQGTTIVQGLDGNTGWAINPMAGQTTATPIPEDQVKMSAGQLDLTGLYNYKKKGTRLNLPEKKRSKGLLCML